MNSWFDDYSEDYNSCILWQIYNPSEFITQKIEYILILNNNFYYLDKVKHLQLES